MNLLELQTMIHQQNRELGWWDEPRPFSTFVCLFHSELSEAMEGDRKGLMDDHLTQYPMFQVELADFVIRCLDWLGSQKDGNAINEVELLVLPSRDNCENLAELHDMVSRAFSSDEYKCQFINDAVAFSFEIASYNNFDLNQIILDKVEYNKHRADHKRENRAKAGGKKY